MIASWKRDEMLNALARKHHIEGQTDALTRVYIAAMDSLMKAYSGKSASTKRSSKRSN